MSLASPAEELQKGANSCGGDGGAVVVGYALPPKKVESFITPSLLNVAKQRGIHLLPIDLAKPLLNQAPFRCIIHKLSTPDWNQQLIQYSSHHPNVPIIDPPQAIQRLSDRLSMLQVVAHLQIPSPSSSSFGIPDQICVQNTGSLQKLQVTGLNLKFPVIAKSLVANGSAKSHQMYLVLNREGLHKLEMEMEPPFVLQQFVNHGGVVFKVYVVGDYVNCVKRPSLPDCFNWDDDLSLVSFSQISNLPSPPNPSKQAEQEANANANAMPPSSFLADLAKALRDALKLHLFNFDVIRDTSSTRSPDHRYYYIIDINYFPGYAKMPSYETVFTDFLLGILRCAS